MSLDFLKNIFINNYSKEGMVWNNEVFNYEYLYSKIILWSDKLKDNNLLPGTIVALSADFSPNAIALLLALIEHKCIIVPMINIIGYQKDEYIKITQAEVSIVMDDLEEAVFYKLNTHADNELYNILIRKKHSGLVLLSSGSTGRAKATVHDFENFMQKYRQKGKDFRTLAFLLFDHIGGIDTVFYALSNASCIITTRDRSAESVCKLIENFQVEVLPASPTFLNLLVLSEAYRKYDLSSLKIITYGTESMPEYILKKCNEIFPTVKFIQKYGTTEIGTLKSKSKNNNSLWVKVGGEGFETRIVDGLLEIKAKSAMLGYLNAPSPFTEDGWFKTGDQVEVDGDYYKILGRKSELINVGGEKVYPSEVESVILEINNVAEVTVYGEKNPIIGNIVCAKVRLIDEETKKEFVQRLKIYCNKRMQSYKVPVKVMITGEKQFSERYKKKRV